MAFPGGGRAEYWLHKGRSLHSKHPGDRRGRLMAYQRPLQAEAKRLLNKHGDERVIILPVAALLILLLLCMHLLSLFASGPVAAFLPVAQWPLCSLKSGHYCRPHHPLLHHNCYHLCHYHHRKNSPLVARTFSASWAFCLEALITSGIRF